MVVEGSPLLMGVDVSVRGCTYFQLLHHPESRGFMGARPQYSMVLGLAFCGRLLKWPGVEKPLVPGLESGYEKPPHFPAYHARQKCQQLVLSMYFSNKLFWGVGDGGRHKIQEFKVGKIKILWIFSPKKLN